MIKSKHEFLAFLSVMTLIALAFSFFLFGMVGIRIVVGIIFISFPFYMILNSFELTEGEKFVFSTLMGLTIFSSLAYILGLAVSFKIAIALTFAAFAAAAFLLGKYSRPTK